MPLYEFKCRGCGRLFEELVRDGDTPACPACRSQDLERLLSLFAAKSEDRSRAAFKKAKSKAAKSQRDATREELEHYYHEHDHDPDHGHGH
jgi:putative FmdB family regulatory protein